MHKLYIFIIFLVISTCTRVDIPEQYKGAVVRYKYLDTNGGWLELGLQKGKKKYLIYLPKTHSILYHIGDTIK